MNKLVEGMYVQAFKALAYLVILFTVLGFGAWVVSKFWVYIVAILVCAIGARLYYKMTHYW